MKYQKNLTLCLMSILLMTNSLTGCIDSRENQSPSATTAFDTSIASGNDFSSTSIEGSFTVKLGDKAFVPLEAVSKILELELEVQKNGEFVLNTDKDKITGKAGSTEITVNDKKHYLPLPVMKIENQIFVPDQFVVQYLCAGVYYNEKTKELMLKKSK